MEALGINLAGLITQIVSFVILFFLLKRFLYRPIVGMLDQRAERIKDSLEAAERASQDAARSEGQIQEQLSTAREEGQQLISQARETADKFREDEMASVRREIDQEKVRAQANIQRERDVAIEELRREFAGLAIAAAEKVIENSLDDHAHRELIERVLEESISSSSSQG